MDHRTWVIGGRRGIGQAITNILDNRDGAFVSATDEDDVNVTSMLQLTRHYATFKPHTIVYCAGINKLMPAGDSFDEFDAMNMLDINALGFIRVMALIGATEIGHRPINVVAITSDASRIPMRNSMAYCASKAALTMAVRCAARELAPHTSVNAVSPGTVARTSMTDSTDTQVEEIKGWKSGESRKKDNHSNPMGRRALPSEIASAVIMVLNAPHYMTGAIIEVNGGR